MISHRHRCIFTHVPKTGGKAVLSAFGLPMLAADYAERLAHIVEPYGHRPLLSYRRCAEFGYFKFAVVRNPWDRLVSAFFYLDAGGCNAVDRRYRDTELASYRGDFRAFVQHLRHHIGAVHFRPQSNWLADRKGRLLADFIARFEQLDTDFEVVATRLSLPSDLPRLNASAHRPYGEYYDDESREIVARLYRRDIELFAYEF